MEQPAHDFELTQTISLLQLSSRALIDARKTCTAVFSAPEMLLDIDFPGHYMRRICSLSLSTPCIVGPHVTVAATFSLTEHKYRVSSVLSRGDDHHESSEQSTNVEHFRTDRVPITQVAISSGLQDSGMFQLESRDGDRFQPFQGAGAISTWRLTLPTTMVQFDRQAISDVVIHMQYTAVDGRPLLCRAASEAVETFSKKVKEVVITKVSLRSSTSRTASPTSGAFSIQRYRVQMPQR
ncbi:PA14 domain [Fusarium albosuccineum]|uniref:PA14 domain n=1 Tax=Fusarium albosuccineum TaxID=1237068 RepID=A0A8H4KQM5_9HYPO|nr:PA14 domain [Fusarium albosuccineum]